MKGKRLAAALAVSVMTFSSAVSVSAAVPEGLFDPEYYAATYADVKAAFGNDAEVLYRHYLEYGIQEGRAGSSVFDVRAYRARYQDLEAAYGDDWEAYFQHYLTCGIQEGRNGSPTGAAPAQNGSGAGTAGSGTTPGGAGAAGSTAKPGSEGTAGGTTQPGPAEQDQFMETMAREAFEAVNRYRAENGKEALTWSDSIYEAAKVRAQECAEECSQTRPDGSRCFSVFGSMGISYGAAAENIAAGYATGEAAAEGWYNSDGHRKNMLGDSYKKAAIACYYVVDGTEFKYYWVNLFTD